MKNAERGKMNIPYWIIVIFIFIALVTLLAIILHSKSVRENSVKSFDIQSYSKILEDPGFLSDLDFSIKINDRETVIQYAEKAWETRNFQPRKKPYEVFYDELNGTWLVMDYLPPSKPGGRHHVLITENGKVIAMWGTN